MESGVGEGRVVANTRDEASAVENGNLSRFQDQVANQDIVSEDSIYLKDKGTDDVAQEVSSIPTPADINSAGENENLLLDSTTAGSPASITNVAGGHASNGATTEPIGRIDGHAVARRMEAKGAHAACQLDTIKKDTDLTYNSKSTHKKANNKSGPSDIATNENILISERPKDISDHTQADLKTGKDATTNVEYKVESTTGQTSKYREKDWKNVFQLISTFCDNAKACFCRHSYERHLSRMGKSGMGAWRAGNVPSDVILHNLVHVRT